MVIHQRVIGQYTLPGGKVYSYTREISKEIQREAKFLAPVRTGRLRNSIDAGLHYANQHKTAWQVTASSGHALFVHEGTRGKTMPHGSGPMRLYGSFPGGWMNTRYAPYQGARVWEVAGQTANPFLQTAMRAVLVQHGLI